MRTYSSPAELRLALAGAPRPLGFVPTMGALHAGHAALVERCRGECATTVASIFVNPLQFGEGEDLARYPRPLASDQALLERLGTACLFLPSAAALIPEGFATTLEVGELGERFEGALRPGHFRGVATMVLKLFHIVGCDRAYFGRKDAQQLAVVRRIVRDLDLPVQVVPVATVREPDGLALSSRNAYLDAGQRAQAPGLSAGLFRARAAWAEGERDRARIEALARSPGLAYDYAALVDPDTFEPARREGPALLVAAVRLGSTRLIDNVSLEG